MEKLRAIIKRLMWLWRLQETYGKDLDGIIKEVNQHVTTHVDLHMREPSICIAIGRYRTGDYVRIFNIEHDSFPQLITRLQAYERHSKLGRIDAGPLVSSFVKDWRKSNDC